MAAELGPVTVTVSVSLGTTELPVKPITFDVQLHAIENTKLTDTSVTYSVDLDRTELREQLAKSVRTLADQVEGAFLAPGAVVLTCDKCDAQIISQTLATLRHEADGAHSLGQGDWNHDRHYVSEVPAEVKAGTILGRFEAAVSGNALVKEV